MEEAERCDRLAFIHDGKLVAEDTPDGIKSSLTDRDVFAVHCRYDREVVARAKGLAGIEVVNQFGRTLRLVAGEGLYDPGSLREALGLTGSSEIEVARDQPTIEDVFVTLTGQRP
jgi:ABC-type multidrug transport system ATPase subunit